MICAFKRYPFYWNLTLISNVHLWKYVVFLLTHDVVVSTLDNQTKKVKQTHMSECLFILEVCQLWNHIYMVPQHIIPFSAGSSRLHKHVPYQERKCLNECIFLNTFYFLCLLLQVVYVQACTCKLVRYHTNQNICILFVPFQKAMWHGTNPNSCDLLSAHKEVSYLARFAQWLTLFDAETPSLLGDKIKQSLISLCLLETSPGLQRRILLPSDTFITALASENFTLPASSIHAVKFNSLVCILQ